VFLLNLRNRHFLFLDILLLAILPSLALALRDVPQAWASYTVALAWLTGLALAIKLPIFYLAGMYRHYWRYASTDELLQIVAGVLVSTLLVTSAFWSLRLLGILPADGFPRSVPLLDGLLTLVAVGGTRFSVRAASHWQIRKRPADRRRRVLIVGAGDAGRMIARELRGSQQINLMPVGFIDDDKEKQGIHIHGIPVLGSRVRLSEMLTRHQIQDVIIAMPTAPGTILRQIVQVCEASGVSYKTVPGMYELLLGRVSVTRLREVQIEDLLRREPVQIDMSSVTAMIARRRVLVTGAGGSIGSELCRQIIRAGPTQLILVGHGENSLFNLMAELPRLIAADPDLTSLDLQAIVADVRDHPRMESIFQRYQPELVFHAAAHKHVPLMESNPEDAVSNNVLGTRTVVELAERYNVLRFIMISTDKAVNPISIMGVTKRVAERVVTDVAQRSGRPYACVRFGNVLGSRGSVVPFFRQQIASGGPVTVTHPEMKRYFMTIPEAVQLVLQAATLTECGEVFVLDMGQPVRIADLAHDLIELSGYQVGRDIEIQYTGLRPGEKLFEELFLQSEDYHRTQHSHVFVAHPESFLPKGSLAVDVSHQVDYLIEAASKGQRDQIETWLKILVPEYESLPRADAFSSQPPSSEHPFNPSVDPSTTPFLGIPSAPADPLSQPVYRG
jgi:FlaA1/EpsC-like NDP-sugar epimerase